MTWTNIVNKGQSQWVVIQSNQPNSALANTYCNAVPDVDDWASLSDNKTLGSTINLQRKGKVRDGSESLVVDVAVRLWYQYGNQYKKRGMFLKTIWTEVQRCDVQPGFEVAMNFFCSDPWNDNTSTPDWPAAMINIGFNAAVKTKKWEKPVEKWRYLLMYNGNLVIQ
jgi:hypothetical protein